MPQINYSKVPFELKAPTTKNTGGYRNYISPLGGIIKTVPAYSPIDLAIAGLSEVCKDEPIPITDLSVWYIKNEPLAEAWVSCTISDYGRLMTHTIAEFKSIFKYKTYLQGMFKRNAPFTFRN